MDIISYLDLLYGAIINVIFYCIIINKIFKIRKIKDKKIMYFTILLTSIAISIINIYNQNMFKALITIPLVAIAMYKIFDIKISKALYCTLIASFYLLIGDMIVGIIFPILNLKFNFLETNILGKTIGNILVTIATIPLLYLTFLSKIFRKLYNLKINFKVIMIIFFIFLIIGSAFVFKSSDDINNIISIIMNFIIFSVFILLLCFSYNKTEKVNKISNEYNTLLDYLDKYEMEIIEKRKLVHDFKNKLIIINGYVENNSNLKEYLNAIIDEQKNIKETKVVKNIDKLPKGLKGLIYYKLSQIDGKTNIVLNVKSNSDVFEHISSKDNSNLLKIVGILIDNAIESVMETKEKYLFIDIKINKENFEMNIINSCENTLEKNKLMDLGFSTKGKNRGYGLSLVKDIIRNDDRYKLEFDSKNNNVETKFSMKIK